MNSISSWRNAKLDDNFLRNFEKDLISCLMLIRDIKFLDEAIEQFNQQTYQHKELVIVFDDICIENYIKEHYIQNNIILVLSKVKILSEKRNESLDASHGEYLCLWDCDDLFSKDRLEVLVSTMKKEQTRICRVDKFFMINQLTGEKFISSSLGFGFGCMVGWKRTVDRFEGIEPGEDYTFYKKITKKYEYSIINRSDLYTYCWHGGNLSNFSAWVWNIDKSLSKPKIKTLIYYVSKGELFSKLTNYSIKTLLTKGKYEGDILVLGDDYFIDNNEHNVKVIDITNSNVHPQHIRYLCGNLIDLKDYDKIIYIDSDIEVLRNVYPLLILESGLNYTEEDYHTHLDFGFGLPASSYYFTEEEFELYKNEKIINSGFFCIDVFYFKKLIEIWKTISERKTAVQSSDQAAFNLIVLKKIFPINKISSWYINYLWNGEHTVYSELAILEHYLGDKKGLIDKIEKQ